MDFDSISGSCCRGCIKRVIQLSSAAAISGIGDVGEIDESSWNEGALNEVKARGRAASPVSNYQASTYMAEKGALNNNTHIVVTNLNASI